MTNWNEEGRTTNVKLRNSSGFILAAIKIAERSDILNSSIFNLQSSFVNPHYHAVKPPSTISSVPVT